MARVSWVVLRSRMLAAVLSLLVPALAGAQGAIAHGAYSAHVEVRTGMCCSASCGAVSTSAEVTLTLAADGTAALHWVRSGCGVTISSGDTPQHMPRDPGPPEAVCAMRGPDAEQRVYDDDVTLRGTWQGRGEGAVVALDRDTTMQCAPATIDGHALLSCTIDARGIDATGLTLDGHVHLDRRRGLHERLDASDQLVIERR